MKKNILILISFAIALIYSCNSINLNPEITKEELKEHISFLASDSLKGRYPGTPEDKVAADYIAEEFNSVGLNLLFNNGLQEFKIQSNLKLGDNNSLNINDSEYIVEKDFIPLSFSANDKIESDVVFVGYGFHISGEKVLWDDYENMDINGKWVLILRGEPEFESSIPFAMYSSLRSKATTAKDLGAAGVIFVSGESFDKEDQLIELEKPEGNINIPVLQVKRKAANQIISNYTISQLEKEINESQTSKSFTTNKKITVSTDVNIDYKKTYNIAAELVTNPKNDKYIVIGAHYDHLGFGGFGTGSRDPNNHAIHYGADDNASGVASVIEIAEKLASIKDSLNTNFIFVAFGAEEMGLLGSKHFTSNLPVPDSLIKAMINIDMLGRMKPDSSLQISGVGTSLEGESLLNELNNNYNFNLGFSYEGYGPSDHSSFYTKNIPVFFFSTGAHIDYHTPGDSVESINFDGMQLASNYIYDFTNKISSDKIQLTFQEAGPKVPQMSGRKQYKVTLGIMPDFSNVEKRGLRADIVIKDKPADKAGMKNGDIITAIDGYPVGDIYEYMERLTKLKAGQIITVEILREDKKEVLIVQL